MFMQRYTQVYLAGAAAKARPAMMPVRSFGAIVKADGEHQFLAQKNKKTLVFDGLKPTSNLVHEITNNYRHQNDLPLIK